LTPGKVITIQNRRAELQLLKKLVFDDRPYWHATCNINNKGFSYVYICRTLITNMKENLVTRADINPLKACLRECNTCHQVDWYGVKLDDLELKCVPCTQESHKNEI
jgi:hypothetical protein